MTKPTTNSPESPRAEKPFETTDCEPTNGVSIYGYPYSNNGNHLITHQDCIFTT